MEVGVFARVNQQSMSICDLARALEERGIESLFVGEHTHAPVATVPDGYHDAAMVENARSVPAPFLLLAAAAAVTQRLRLGTSISLIAQHDPLVYAKEVATLDMMSGGRVELGVGYGWNRAEMLNHGMDPRRRRAAFREKLRAVELLWAQEVAEFAGEFASFSASWSWPKPVQGPRPRVLIGAPARDGVFRDIVELADGWMPSAHFTDSELSDQIAQLRLTASEGGRSPDELSVTLLESRAAMEQLSIDEFIDRCPNGGRVARWGGLGVERVVVGVPVTDRDAALQMLDHVAKLTAGAARV